MYQPYIRGKQFELIGIRELVKPVLSLNNAKVSPIIEPVRDSSTLKTTLKELADNNVNFTIIVNPQVGTFKDSGNIFNILREAVGHYNNYQIGVIFHNKIIHEKAINILQKFSKQIPSLSIIHNAEFSDISEIITSYKNQFTVKYNVINLKLTSRRYFRNFEESTRIELEDNFKSQIRNSDYLKIDESTFSEEHLYFKSEGFIGFSDYLAIGEEYSETGFLPYAVAIHLSYASLDGKIKVKHFVSDSNEDTSDIAGKFAEALKKLIDWCNINKYDSIAVKEYRDLYDKEHFPGLGTLKKLSLMNHIDLVLKLI